MCQTNAVLERHGQSEVVLENVTKLELRTDGLHLTNLFGEIRILPELFLHHIDFAGGKIYLLEKDKM